jgi:replicative DNA helicase
VRATTTGGLAYLGELAANTPSAANIRRYAEIVRERAILRQLVTAGDEIAGSALNPLGRDPKTLLDEAEAKVFAIAEGGFRHQSGFVHINPLLTQVVERIQELHDRDNPSDITGVPTGYHDLDAKTSGLQPGDLLIVAGRPSMGKTSFALNIAEHVAIEVGCRWPFSRWKWAARSLRCACCHRSAGSMRIACVLVASMTTSGRACPLRWARCTRRRSISTRRRR